MNHKILYTAAKGNHYFRNYYKLEKFFPICNNFENSGYLLLQYTRFCDSFQPLRGIPKKD